MSSSTRYHANLTAGALKVPESRVIADLLLQNLPAAQWKAAIEHENVLQTRRVKTAKRLTSLIRSRLGPLGPNLWKLVRDGSTLVATHACLAAAIRQSALLADFLDLVVREQYRLFQTSLTPQLWEKYLAECLSRDPELPQWSKSTGDRLRSSVFQILAEAGYIESTRTLKLQTVYIAREVLKLLADQEERHVLRCIQVAP